MNREQVERINSGRSTAGNDNKSRQTHKTQDLETRGELTGYKGPIYLSNMHKLIAELSQATRRQG